MISYKKIPFLNIKYKHFLPFLPSALPTTPRIPLRRNKSPHLSTTSRPPHTTRLPQQQRQPAPNSQQQRATVSQSQTHQPSNSHFPRPAVTANRVAAVTTLVPTTNEGDTFPTTQEPFKTMPTASPEEQPEETTSIPQTGRVKIMPGLTLNLEPAIHNNEIIHSGPLNPLQLLMPPTRDFSRSHSTFSSSSLSSPIPLQAEASTNFTIRRPLSRKETFSWAFADQGSK